MNIFICDDDNLVCEQIKTLCESYYIEHKLKRPETVTNNSDALSNRKVDRKSTRLNSSHNA